MGFFKQNVKCLNDKSSVRNKPPDKSMWQMVRAAEKHLTNLQCLFFRFNLA